MPVPGAIPGVASRVQIWVGLYSTILWGMVIVVSDYFSLINMYLIGPGRVSSGVAELW